MGLSVVGFVQVKAESVSTGADVTFDPEEYVDSFKPDMMEVLHAWSKGAKFREICKMTVHFEVFIVIPHFASLSHLHFAPCISIRGPSSE